MEPFGRFWQHRRLKRRLRGLRPLDLLQGLRKGPRADVPGALPAHPEQQGLPLLTPTGAPQAHLGGWVGVMTAFLAEAARVWRRASTGCVREAVRQVHQGQTSQSLGRSWMPLAQPSFLHYVGLVGNTDSQALPRPIETSSSGEAWASAFVTSVRGVPKEARQCRD